MRLSGTHFATVEQAQYYGIVVLSLQKLRLPSETGTLVERVEVRIDRRR